MRTTEETAMGTITHIFRRAQLRRELRAQRKQLKKAAAVHRSKFYIEPLESRLLLSAESRSDQDDAGGEEQERSE